MHFDNAATNGERRTYSHQAVLRHPNWRLILVTLCRDTADIHESERRSRIGVADPGSKHSFEAREGVLLIHAAYELKVQVF